MKTPTIISEAEQRFPTIIGEPRSRNDVFSRNGWYQLMKTEYGDWWWPIMCTSISGPGDCPACSYVPFWSLVMADAIEEWLRESNCFR